MDRTLNSSKGSADKPLKRQKISKAEKKTRQRRREEIKQQRANSVRDSQNEEIRNQSIERLNQLRALTAEQQAEIERIQNTIANELVESVTYAKQQLQKDYDDEESDSELPPNWKGLTPGLAPVGYEPDSSDDEPY